MNDESIKKQNYVIFSLACLLSFVMGCCFFNTLFNQDTNLGNKTIAVQTRTILTGDNTNKTTGTIIVNKQPNLVKAITTTGNKNVYQKPTQSILGVHAGYDGETEYERVRNQMIKLGLSYEIAEHITWVAYTTMDDPKLFVKNIIGVSNAEGGIFQHGLYNNYLGVMSRKTDGSYGLRHYATIQLAITDWAEMYNRNKRYNRTAGQRWLDGNYCASACNSRISNYNAGIYLLNI